MFNAKLQSMIKLSSKITVYIPSTIDICKKIDNKVYVNECALLLSELFGGATSTPVLGYWSSPSAGLVKERTTMVFAYCSDSDLEIGINKVIDYCEIIKAKLTQDNIAIEINGEMYFV